MMRLAVLLCVATTASALTLDQYIEGRQGWLAAAVQNPEDLIAAAGITGFTFFTINENTPTANLEHIKDMLALIYWVVYHSDIPNATPAYVVLQIKKMIYGICFLGDTPVVSVEQVRVSFNDRQGHVVIENVFSLVAQVLQWRIDRNFDDIGWTDVEDDDDASDVSSFHGDPEYHVDDCPNGDCMGARDCRFCQQAWNRMMARQEKAERHRRDGYPSDYDSDISDYGRRRRTMYDPDWNNYY